VTAPEPEPPLFELHADDALLAPLRRAQRLLLEHPAAAQRLFSALVAEGRQYAHTPEGAALAARLEGSELIRRGRIVWDVATLNVLEESPRALLPTRLMDAFVQATAVEALEPFLARLFGLTDDDAPAPAHD
jgi:hypothetical protein